MSVNMKSDQMREKLMVASYLGGCSIAASYVGLVHPFSAALSVVLGIHHGLANCIAMRGMQPYYPKYFEELLKRLEKNSDIDSLTFDIDKKRFYDMKQMEQEKVVAGRSISEILKRFDKKMQDPRSFNEGKKIVKIIRSFLKINCKLPKLDEKLLDFAKKNNIKKNVFKEFKSIQNLKKLNQEIIFITNFGRDIEYYTGIVFEIFSGTKEIARGGRYDDLLKSLGANKNIPAVGAAINLNNL